MRAVFVALVALLSLCVPAAAQNAYTISNTINIGVVPADRSIVGVADINGDGKADVLFQTTTGDVYEGSTFLISLPSGYTVIGGGTNNVFPRGVFLAINPATNDLMIVDPKRGRRDHLGAFTAGYTVVGVGGGTAQGDLLIAWQNPTTFDTWRWKLSSQMGYVVQESSQWGTLGGNVFAFMYESINGVSASFLGYASLHYQQLNTDTLGSDFKADGVSPFGYVPVAVDDFNGDHQSDVIWYNSRTGDIIIGETDTCGSGGVVPTQSYVSIGTMPVNSTIVGFGDFDGDGVPDLLFFDSVTRQMSVGLGQVTGSTVCSITAFPPFSFNPSLRPRN